MLRESKMHSRGTAYEIYRATDHGGLELRGVRDDRLEGVEAMCFLRTEAAAARRDYDAIAAAAKSAPVPCFVEMVLAKIQAFDPPHVTGLSFPAAATAVVAGWLTTHAASAGDRVVSGIRAYVILAGFEGSRIESCQLPALMDYTDRSMEDVLRSVNRPIQR